MAYAQPLLDEAYIPILRGRPRKRCRWLLADKGYDSDAFVEDIQRRGAEAIIPSKKNRLNPRSLDRHLYKARNLVERFFQKLKQFRRIATRYERLARKYQSMLSLVSAVIWLA